jgi:hypothetical protein
LKAERREEGQNEHHLSQEVAAVRRSRWLLRRNRSGLSSGPPHTEFANSCSGQLGGTSSHRLYAVSHPRHHKGRSEHHRPRTAVRRRSARLESTGADSLMQPRHARCGTLCTPEYSGDPTPARWSSAAMIGTQHLRRATGNAPQAFARSVGSLKGDLGSTALLEGNRPTLGWSSYRRARFTSLGRDGAVSPS